MVLAGLTEVATALRTSDDLSKGTPFHLAAGTWMAEHFCETLEELKCLVDLLLLSGVNHVFYHGCCYSPDDAAWPGWVFYASTEMNPRNPIWHDAAHPSAIVLPMGYPDDGK